MIHLSDRAGSFHLLLLMNRSLQDPPLAGKSCWALLLNNSWETAGYYFVSVENLQNHQGPRTMIVNTCIRKCVLALKLLDDESSELLSHYQATCNKIIVCFTFNSLFVNHMSKAAWYKPFYCYSAGIIGQYQVCYDQSMVSCSCWMCEICELEFMTSHSHIDYLNYYVLF